MRARSARYKSRAIPAAATALALLRGHRRARAIPAATAAPAPWRGAQAKAYMYVYIEHMYTKWAEVLARCHL